MTGVRGISMASLRLTKTARAAARSASKLPQSQVVLAAGAGVRASAAATGLALTRRESRRSATAATDT
jgi:hypothetical protein